MLKAKHWLDTLEYRPDILRGYGLKGKKKVVELFEAYLAIYDYMPEAEKIKIDHKLQKIAFLTLNPRYHDMLKLSDNEFHEDATSYLRLCYLLEKKGFDTQLYRQEISRALARYNGHMWQRGVSQKMIFHRYYEYFQLPEPFSLLEAYKNGIISQRLDIRTLSLSDVYLLTHEIFAAAGLDGKGAIDFFSQDDIIYIKKTLTRLTQKYLNQRNVDIVAELLICMSLIKMEKEKIYKQGLSFLLNSQNPDGSFGSFQYHYKDKVHKDFYKEAFFLHPTMVTLKALQLVADNLKTKK